MSDAKAMTNYVKDQTSKERQEVEIMQAKVISLQCKMACIYEILL